MEILNESSKLLGKFYRGASAGMVLEKYGV